MSAAREFIGNEHAPEAGGRAVLLAAAERSPAQRALRACYEREMLAEGAPERALPLQKACTVVLVRGLFGAWIPGHFREPLKRLRTQGWNSMIARTDPAGTIDANHRALTPQIAQIVAAGRRPLFLAHSKGGLEVLLALAGNPALAAATAGIATVQMPRAGAPYLESVFSNAHRASRRPADTLRESAEGALLTLAGARAACRELDAVTVGAIATTLDRAPRPFPWLGVATDATRPTRSLELKHERLARIAPGEPHDGVFYTADQLWPGARMLLLSGIDHAQPSVGGLGFAHDRFWCALLALLLALAPTGSAA